MGNVPGTPSATQKDAKKGGWGLQPVATVMPTSQKDTGLLEIFPSTESWLGLLNSHPSPLPQCDPFSCNELMLSLSAQQGLHSPQSSALSPPCYGLNVYKDLLMRDINEAQSTRGGLRNGIKT